MNLYKESILYKKIVQSHKIAFFDIDLTLTGDPSMQQKLRKFLEKDGYGIIFVTSRPYELVLSDAARALSPTLTRPLPKTEITSDGIRYHKDLGKLDAFKGIYDPDAIACTTGLEIYIQLKSGEYIKDESYQSFNITSKEWKRRVLELLERIPIDTCTYTLKRYEVIENFHKNIADIIPLEYRIQVDVPDIKSRNLFLKYLKAFKDTNTIYAVDDSEPENGKYSLYLLPITAESLKAQAVDAILTNLLSVTGMKSEDLHVLLSGDSYPDLSMGLYSAKGTNVYFVLPGGSRMTTSFTDKNKKTYIDIDISIWKKELHKVSEGIYRYQDRNIFICDELFPGKKHAESIQAFLQSSYI